MRNARYAAMTSNRAASKKHGSDGRARRYPKVSHTQHSEHILSSNAPRTSTVARGVHDYK